MEALVVVVVAKESFKNATM